MVVLAHIIMYEVLGKIQRIVAEYVPGSIPFATVPWVEPMILPLPG